ncbi:hypothetical protein KMI_18g19950 [Encephalitozoon hellem]|nr:hypothetical protein KMI_18g19950 [Encephalitozoon hellem]
MVSALMAQEDRGRCVRLARVGGGCCLSLGSRALGLESVQLLLSVQLLPTSICVDFDVMVMSVSRFSGRVSFWLMEMLVGRFDEIVKGAFWFWEMWSGRGRRMDVRGHGCVRVGSSGIWRMEGWTIGRMGCGLVWSAGALDWCSVVSGGVDG